MNLHEYQAKEILSGFGVRIQRGYVASSPEEAVEEAKKLFKKYNWPTVDVSRKSVEETAASVIKIYEIAKNNGQ